MRDLKKVIIIISVLLLLLIITIIAVRYVFKWQSDQDVGLSDELKTELMKLDNYTTYYSIEKMMKNYYLYLKVQNKTAVYSLLDKEYIAQNNIESENVIEKLSLGEISNSNIKVKEIYTKQDYYYPTFLVKFNKEHYIFYMDNGEGSFSIYPITEDKYNAYVKGITELQIKDDKIGRNDYNRILQDTLEEEERVERYFEEYLQNALYNVEDAYNSIEEEYCQKKFGNIIEYKKYISEKYEQLSSMDYTNLKTLEDFKTRDEYMEYISNLNTKGLEQYQIIEYDDFIIYICIDSYENYYVFKETLAFQYTVMLDTYTVDLPKFVEKYEDSTQSEKMILNIQKLIDATKAGDYKYVYNKLDDTFKSTYFRTQQDFEKYVKQKYDLQDTISYKKYEEINNTLVYEIQLKNSSGYKKTESKILMQLKDGTDFVFSFSME